MLRVVAVVALLLWATGAMATNYVWTGASDGNWSNAANWNVEGVPVDIQPGSGALELSAITNRIVINAPGATTPVPTSNIATFGGNTGAFTPQLDLLYGTSTVTLVAQGIYHENAWWTSTVGDGDTGNGLAELNYNMNVSQNCINRHNNGGVHFTVENDGTLNINLTTAGTVLQFSFGGANHATYFTVGGVLNVNKAVQLDGLPGNYFLLNGAGASVTAGFGGSYTNIADVVAELGDGKDFRMDATGLDTDVYLKAVDNGSSFTVILFDPPPKGTVLIIR